MTLAEFNQLPSYKLSRLLLECCHSQRWAQSMINVIPSNDIEGLLNAAKRLWSLLAEEDYLEAFGGHAQIGDLQALKKKYATITQREQGHLLAANDDILQQLHELNQIYLEKFGFIFIVCASNKSAEEMLAILKKRVQNERQQEIDNAGREQSKITELRLRKLFNA